MMGNLALGGKRVYSAFYVFGFRRGSNESAKQAIREARQHGGDAAVLCSV
jgi:hypothetical protein